MGNEHDYILRFFERIEKAIADLKSETKEQLTVQQAAIDELKDRTLIPKDARRIDLLMAVFREHPLKTYMTVWLIIVLVVIDKTGGLGTLFKGFIGFAVAGE